jgi:hypothetical protein
MISLYKAYWVKPKHIRFNKIRRRVGIIGDNNAKHTKSVTNT